MKAVLYSRRDCHLCDDMQAAITPLLAQRGLQLAVIDIDTDPALVERFGVRIPVFTLDDEIICEGRPDEAAVRDALGLSGA
ncbi:MAG TPA: glutaredoxin family protein [Gammaproteobacteria bacterium]|nr:glutaredoxin family protein [Gammaproteobacteria bacterium]